MKFETMAQHIGIVACSAEGAALCYRTICLEAREVMGEHNHPEVTMNSVPLAEYMRYIRDGDWKSVAELLLVSASKVAKAGATFAICPDNTCHEAFSHLLHSSPIPWLHIADVVAEEASSRGFSAIGVMGTKYLMEGPVYADALKKRGLGMEIPAEDVRLKIDAIIFNQLVNGIFTEESRLYFNEVMETFKARGCDAAVLGCTEIPLIVRADDAPLPILDSTRLLARAALRKALTLAALSSMPPLQ
jgi:aspartate racemase